MRMIFRACVAVAALMVIVTTVSCGKSKKDPLPGGNKLEFYETYRCGELQISKLIDEVAKQKGDSAANALRGMLTGMQERPVLFFSAKSDTAFVNEMVAQCRVRILPVDLKLSWTLMPNHPTRDNRYCLVALKTTGASGLPCMTGKTITDVKTEKLGEEYAITIEMNEEGARQWYKITSNNVGRNIAIVFKNRVYSYPNVKAGVNGGRTQITCNFTKEEANELAKALRGEK